MGKGGGARIAKGNPRLFAEALAVIDGLPKDIHNTRMVQMARLRRKIEPDPAGEPRCIRTVRNAGYMFIPNES